MILEQYYLACLAHASYLIADEKSGLAVVVDPRRDVDLYLEEAKKHGVEIRYVFLTHFHADFLAGHLELRQRVGAEIRLGAEAEADYPFVPMKTGDTLDLGPRVRLGTIETPGHTPEGISILVYDLEQSAENPHAVLTGDTLFIGDVGRPDLMASVGMTADELAGMLYESVYDKLMKLPDATLVYPAHGAGSMCGKSLSTDTVSTIGAQRRENAALQAKTRESFIAEVTRDQPEVPAYFGYDAMLNRQERGTLDDALAKSVRPLALDEVVRLMNASGAQAIDTRPASAFAGKHLVGSISIGLDGKYATWAGTLLDTSHPIVVIAEAGREEESILRLGRIGFDHIAGYLEGGIDALEGREALVARFPRLAPRRAAEVLAETKRPFLLDVRTPGEFASGHVAGAVNVPLNRLRDETDTLPHDRELLLYCRSGYRSTVAASLLASLGFERVSDMTGGILAWTEGDLPCVTSEGASCGG